MDVSGFPTFAPVPLDFEEESPVYFFSFLRYKFLRRDGRLVWYLQESRHSKSKDGWTEFCVIDLTPRELSFFDETMDEIYGDPDSDITPFHKSFRAIAFSRPGKKLVALKDTSLLLENDSRHLDEIKLSSVEEVLEKVNQYFPFLSKEAGKAVKNVTFNFPLDSDEHYSNAKLFCNNRKDDPEKI